MALTKVYALILIAVIVSFVGFCVENVFISFTHGFVDNRNMVLPFLFGYGMAIVAFYLLFGTPDKPLYWCREISFSKPYMATLYCFLIAFLGVSIGEIILGYATEKICGIIWWDYSVIPLHITRYTSVPTSMGFAALITIFMKFFFNPLLSLFSKMNPTLLGFLAISLGLLLSLDMMNSAFYMLKHADTLRIWRFEFKKPLKDLILNFGS